MPVFSSQSALYDYQTTGNLVQGNLIGLGANGQVIAGATNPGVYIADNSSGNTIGGTVPSEANVVSGNTSMGSRSATTSGNLVEGNLIGTDITGKSAVPNSDRSPHR